MRKIYSALDIGSDTIKLVIGEFINNKLNILCAIKEETRGFKHNEITDSEELIHSIKRLLKQAKDTINFDVKRVIVNISSYYNNFIVTEATNKIENEEGIVTSNDILMILKSSAANRISPSEELVSAIPVIFKVGDNETTSPYNKKGKTISVKSVLVTTDKKKVYDLAKLLEKCNLEIVDIATTGLVDYYNFKTNSMDKKNSIIINIGNTQTSLSVFSKGIYINNETIDIGGYDIDKDIAFRFNLRRKEARYLKENLALAYTKNAEPKESYKVEDKDGNEIIINQYELSEIVSKKISEMLKMIKKAINHLTKKEISYIIITGGLTKIKDFNLLLNYEFNDKVKIGNINNIGARDNSYSVAIGILHYFNDKLSLRNKDYSTISESDIENMCNNDSRLEVASDSILGKVFGYFFDN